LQHEGHAITALHFNPNVHPYQEWDRRREAVRDHMFVEKLPVVWHGTYDIDGFLRDTLPDWTEPGRCRRCYSARLGRAAELAREMDMDAFSTTLTVSPYQKHDMIREEGERAAQAHGVRFLYRDFRPLYRDGMSRARATGLYVQPYCGCIFSERDRYQKDRT
jgi:predicted adenine nucleotide alpha hydrolase (AANH) superfamily ATPase